MECTILAWEQFSHDIHACGNEEEDDEPEPERHRHGLGQALRRCHVVDAGFHSKDAPCGRRGEWKARCAKPRSRCLFSVPVASLTAVSLDAWIPRAPHAPIASI